MGELQRRDASGDDRYLYRQTTQLGTASASCARRLADHPIERERLAAGRTKKSGADSQASPSITTPDEI